MSHEFSSSVGTFPSFIIVSPLSKMDLKIWSENMKIWEYSLLLPQLSSHYCCAVRTCAVAARRPRSFVAQVARNSARAFGTYYWDKSESCDEMNSLGNTEVIKRGAFLKFVSSLTTAEVGQPPTSDPVECELKNQKIQKGPSSLHSSKTEWSVALVTRTCDPVHMETWKECVRYYVPFGPMVDT